MKKIMLATIILLVLTLSACSKSNGTATPQPTAAPVQGSITKEPDTNRLSIYWEYNNAKRQLPGTMPTFVKLSDKFKVDFQPKFLDLTASNDTLTVNDLPDIFTADSRSKVAAVKSAAEMYQDKSTRAIPLKMIEQYAPKYAAAIKQNEDLFSAAKLNDKPDEFFCLPSFTNRKATLNTYSVYRLDWLEKSGYKPKGTTTEIYPDVFFTTTPFTKTEWIEIMRSMSKDDPDGNGIRDTFGAGISDDQYINTSLESIYAMWGLNPNIKNIADKGKAVPYYTASAYRDMLINLSSLCSDGAILHDPNYYTTVKKGKYGYWTDRAYQLSFGNNQSITETIKKEIPSAKFLITPLYADKADANQYAPDTNITIDINRSSVIRKDVTDSKLAKILEIYDAISFDPETYVSAFYGNEGEDFAWDGKPYNSHITMLKPLQELVFQKGLYIIKTNVSVEDVNKTEYELTETALTRYALSEQAKASIIYDAKELRGDSLIKWNELMAKHETGIKNTVDSYLVNVLKEKDSVNTGWDKYLNELKANGLLELQKVIDEAK